MSNPQETLSLPTHQQKKSDAKQERDDLSDEITKKHTEWKKLRNFNSRWDAGLTVTTIVVTAHRNKKALLKSITSKSIEKRKRQSQTVSVKFPLTFSV